MSLSEGVLQEGHSLLVGNFKGITEVGKQTNSFSFQIVDENGYDVTAEYNIMFRFSNLEIKPRELTITTPNISKIYDGAPLTSNEISSIGLVDGHYIVCEHTGTQTRPGESENSITSYSSLLYICLKADALSFEIKSISISLIIISLSKILLCANTFDFSAIIFCPILTDAV